MSLNITLDINGEAIGRITVTRKEHCDAGNMVRYEYHYSGSLGNSWGSIYHRPQDGATKLAAMALQHSTRGLGHLI